MDKAPTSRFAPSPTGRMHAGNIFSYLYTWLYTRKHHGRVLLRIEDLDASRSRSHFADQIKYDFEALGLYWDGEVLYQSNRAIAYLEAFEQLENKGFTYPCFCTRSDIHAASAPHEGDQLVYPGTCAQLSAAQQEQGIAALASCGRLPSIRMRVGDEQITFEDILQGHQDYVLSRDCGDFVIRRSDSGFAYQLAVVIDDAFQGVNLVVRGADLLDSTPIQIYLQRIFGFQQPQYVHVPLIYAADGRRIAKRHRDASLEELLSRYQSTEGVLGHIASVTGLIDKDQPVSVQDLVECADLTAVQGVKHILWQ